jgi:hypothetical protein
LAEAMVARTALANMDLRIISYLGYSFRCEGQAWVEEA